MSLLHTTTNSGFFQKLIWLDVKKKKKKKLALWIYCLFIENAKQCISIFERKIKSSVCLCECIIGSQETFAENMSQSFNSLVFSWSRLTSKKPWTECELGIPWLFLVASKCSGLGLLLVLQIAMPGSSGKLTFISSLSWPWIL